jgi:hypothetical protein
MAYSITDIAGKELKAGKLNAVGSEVYPVETDELPNGMYFITCKFEKGDAVTQKFVIRK